MFQEPDWLRPYTRAEALAVALGALISATALAVGVHPGAGVIWLLATTPGVYLVARSGPPARTTIAERREGDLHDRPDGSD